MHGLAIRRVSGPFADQPIRRLECDLVLRPVQRVGINEPGLHVDRHHRAVLAEGYAVLHAHKLHLHVRVIRRIAAEGIGALRAQIRSVIRRVFAQEFGGRFLRRLQVRNFRQHIRIRAGQLVAPGSAGDQRAGVRVKRHVAVNGRGFHLADGGFRVFLCHSHQRAIARLVLRVRGVLQIRRHAIVLRAVAHTAQRILVRHAQLGHRANGRVERILFHRALQLFRTGDFRFRQPAGRHLRNACVGIHRVAHSDILPRCAPIEHLARHGAQRILAVRLGHIAQHGAVFAVKHVFQLHANRALQGVFRALRVDHLRARVIPIRNRIPLIVAREGNNLHRFRYNLNGEGRIRIQAVIENIARQINPSGIVHGQLLIAGFQPEAFVFAQRRLQERFRRGAAFVQIVLRHVRRVIRIVRARAVFVEVIVERIAVLVARDRDGSRVVRPLQVPVRSVSVYVTVA